MNSTTPAILVFDIGLTNCKSVVFSAGGVILGHSSVAYPTYHPMVGCVEQNPEDWLKAICTATRVIFDINPGLASQIESISVTGHMHSLVGIDGSGKPVLNALVLGDQRSIDSARKLTMEIGLESIYRITGARMEESMPVAKIHWMKTNAPEIFSRVSLFTGCKDFVRNYLTGDRLTDPIDACAMSLYDLQRGSWATELVNMVGITPGQLPEISLPTTIAGKLRDEAARALGLRAGIPVVVGSGDDIEVLGCGLMEPGKAKEHIGTTGSILSCMATLEYDEMMALEIYPHAEAGLWVIGGSITAAGSALSWAANILGFGELKDVFNSGFILNPYHSNDSLFFIPHLSGERCPSWNPCVRGAWLGLTTSHNRNDLMSAAFVGVAQELNRILERIDALVGAQLQVIVDNRLDNSQEWLQLRANVYNRLLGVTRTHEPTALGAMILGATGIGIYSNIGEASRMVTGTETMIEPEVGLKSSNQDQSAFYRQATAALTSLCSLQTHPEKKT